MPSVTVDFPAPVAQVYAYLAHPVNRPRWQSSLRRIEDLEGDGSVGTTWIDVTSVGARPRMTITEAVPGQTWSEIGTWRGIDAGLRLDFEPTVDGTRVVATFDVDTRGALAPVGALLRRLAPLGIKGDLRRAAQAMAV